MPDLDRALTDIAAIRDQLAAGTVFQGFGPVVMAVTGLLAAGTWAVQALIAPPADPTGLLLGWAGVALLAAGLTAGESIARARRVHGGLADRLLFAALERFVPAGLAGVAIGAVLYLYAPHALWLLPGLWQVLTALGLAAAARALPGHLMLAAGWYFVTGIAVLIVAAGEQTVAPWMMGLPYALGQLLVAILLYLAAEEPGDG